MSRPTTMKVDGTVYWAIFTYTDAGVLVDADSTPSVAVRKNGAAVADAVTITKRAATTGIYDCSHNPAGEVGGDTFSYEETATISSQAYVNVWSLEVVQRVEDIWSEPSAGYTTGGTFGNILKNNPDADQVADAVWDEQQSEHTFPGSLGSYLDVKLSNSLEENMGYYVWDHLLSQSSVAGSFGVHVENLPTAGSVAGAVWDEPALGHQVAGTFGSAVNYLASTTFEDALVDSIWSEDQSTYTTAGTFGYNLDAQVSAAGGGGTAPTEADMYTYFTSASREDVFKADVSGLATSSGLESVALVVLDIDTNVNALNNPTVQDIADGVWDETAASHTAAGTTGSALYTTAIESGLNTVIIDKLDSTFEVDGSGGYQFTELSLENAPTGSGGGSGDWTATEKGQIRYRLGVDGAALTPVATPDLATESTLNVVGVTATDTNLRVQNLNDFDPAVDTVARVTLVDTTTNLTNGGGGGGDSKEDIYTYFTSSNREDAFKADVSGLATSANLESVALVTLDTNAKVNLLPDAVTIVDTWGDRAQANYSTPGTLGYYLDAQVSSAGAGGSGLYQTTVRVQDTNGDALQGARVNVDGTTLTLTTGTSGEVTFNLDSGVYLLEVSPPANYDTPLGQVVTITNADPSDTVFALTSTLPPGGCTPPWIG